MLDADGALEIARTGENAALKFDPRMKNSGGAEFSSGRGQILFANSQGFVGEYAGTSYSLVVAPLAQEGEAMQQGYWYTWNRRFGKLEDAGPAGLTAPNRPLRLLGARKLTPPPPPI